MQPIADRVAPHLEMISKTFPTNQNSAHGIYDWYQAMYDESWYAWYQMESFEEQSQDAVPFYLQLAVLLCRILKSKATVFMYTYIYVNRLLCHVKYTK